MTDIWTILILGVILLWLINVMMPSWQNFTVLLACFRQYMEELVTYVERNPRNKKCSKWKSDAILSSLPTFLREAIRPTAWRECYTKHDIQACLSRVQTVGYNEKRVKILVDWFNVFHSSLLICLTLSLYSYCRFLILRDFLIPRFNGFASNCENTCIKSRTPNFLL